MIELLDCFFKETFGIICPFCGGTRCVFSLLTLNFADAFRYHPVTFIYIFFLVASLIVFLKDKLSSKKSRINYNFLEKSLFVYIAAVIIQYIVRLILMRHNIENPVINIHL